INELRDNITSVDLDRGSDFALVHHEHATLEFRGVSEFGNRFALFHERGLFNLGAELRRDSVEILVVYKFDRNLLSQVATLLLSLPRFDDRAYSFLHFLKRTVTSFLFPIHLDDVNAELRLHEVANRSYTQAERYTFEFRHHLPPPEIAKISTVRGT